MDWKEFGGLETMSWSLEEQETTVTVSRADDNVRIWSAIGKHITRMEKHPSFTKVSEQVIDGHKTATFTIPASDWNPATGAKRRRVLTGEQKKALADRLKEARNG